MKISFLLKTVTFLTNVVRNVVIIVNLIPISYILKGRPHYSIVISYKEIPYLSLLAVVLIECVEGTSREEEGGEGWTRTLDRPLSYSAHIFGCRKCLAPNVYENIQDRGIRKYKRKHSDK